METSSSETLIALELKIANNKLNKFKGITQILITHLNFPHPTRQIDKKIIKQLIKDFKGKEYIQEEPSY